MKHWVVFTVHMKEAKSLATLGKPIAEFKPVMMDFQQKDNAYKFQIAVSIVCHKAVDPAVVTQPPVTLTSEMVAVNADAPPLNDVNRQLSNVIEVYEQNGSGWFCQTLFPYNCHYDVLIHEELVCSTAQLDTNA